MTRGEFLVSTDPAKIDLQLVHRFLSDQSYWAKGIPLYTLSAAIENSLCFSGYMGRSQVAFARVISDFATFANLVDVFVLPDWRGQGLGKRLMAEVVAHPQLQHLRRFTLATSDAHGLYRQFGFAALTAPGSFMERYDPGIYDV